MELDLLNSHFDKSLIFPQEIEEALEDPFGIRLLPDADTGPQRYYALGRSITDKHLFLCFSTDGKNIQLIAARLMSPSEARFYDRHYADFK